MNPIYHMGWVIQPTHHGVFAYERIDCLRSQVDIKFDSIFEAFRYVDKVTRSGNY